MSPRLCPFWCLLGDEAFVVEADLEWDVSQLAEAIQEKQHLRGRTSDIVLRKVRPSDLMHHKHTYLRSSMSPFQLTTKRLFSNVFLNQSPIPLSS
jgi:hypothetical protein